MKHDDQPVGRLVSRREILTFLGASGAALLAGSPHLSSASATPRRRVPACVARPAQTAGPYFVDTKLRRSDIRSDAATGAVKEGTPLALTLAVSGIRAGECSPLAGAHVEIWHCDAMGIYSGVKDPGFDTEGQTFLRGYQITDAAGEARFQTIYPGWYSGRAVHIHFTIRTDPAEARGQEFTSQLYFDDAVTGRVLSRMQYAAKRGPFDRNASDGIFARGGEQLLLATKASGDGYEARFEVGLLRG